MSVNASILHFESLNATLCIGVADHQGNKAENAASPGLAEACRTQCA